MNLQQKTTLISHFKGPEAIFLSWITYSASGFQKEKGTKMPQDNTLYPNGWSNFLKLDTKARVSSWVRGFLDSFRKTGSLLVHFLWCVYTRTEGAQQGCFQGTFRGKPISQESWMPDVKPVCAAEHTLSRMHSPQMTVWEGSAVLIWSLSLTTGKAWKKFVILK